MAECRTKTPTNACRIFVDSKCIPYTGVNLTCIGVNTNDRLDAILVKIDAKVCTSINGGWDLEGNDGTTAGTNFLGTLDDVDVVFKRNESEAMRIIDDGLKILNKLEVDGLGDQTTVRLVVEGEANDNMLIGIKKPSADRYDAMFKFDGYTDPLRHEGGFSWWSGDDLDDTLVKKMTLWPRGGLYIGDALSSDDGKGYKLALYGNQAFHNERDVVYWNDRPTISFPLRVGTNGDNTFLGFNAGENISDLAPSTGDDSSFNTGFGSYALREGTDISYCSAFGGGAFPLLVTGLWMTAIGSGAGHDHLTGLSCTYLGADVAYNSTDNSYATMAGHFSGFNTQATTHNTFYGHASGVNVVGGSGNTLIGSQSADALISGSENIFIGHSSGVYETGSNKFFVNNTNTSGSTEATGRTKALLYGVMNNTTASQTLTVNGKLGVNVIPAASAVVDITSTTHGMLPPRMTDAQKTAISSPATGLTVYCTDCTATDASTGVMQTYNGASWKNYW